MKNLTADFADVLPPQPVLVTVVVTMSPLARAVETYNAQFGTDLRLPIDPEVVEMAANIAERRGKPQLAVDLRAALTEEASA